MADEKCKAIVEALLFVSDRPLGLRQIQEILKEEQAGIGIETVRAWIEELRAFYRDSARSFQIYEIASGYQLKTIPEYAPAIARLLKDDMKDRLSVPALETLAIIAYKQPVTRAEVEAIRGVNIDGVIKTLFDKNVIQVVGKKDVPGKPSLLGTTRDFLLHFGLKDLQDLPNMEEFKQALVARERQLELQRAAAGKDQEEQPVAAASQASETTETGMINEPT